MLAGLHIITQLAIDRTAIGNVTRWDLATYRARYRLFHLDREMAVPAWFSSLLIMLAALLLAALAEAHRRAGRPGFKRWLLAAAVAVGLSADEAVALHENLNSRVGGAVGDETGLLGFGWVLPYLLLVGLMAGAYLPLVWRLPRWAAGGIAAAAAIYVGGSIGCEVVAGLVAADTDGWMPVQHPPATLTVLLIAEEVCEMAGVLLLIATLAALTMPRVSIAPLPAMAEQSPAPTPARAEGTPSTDAAGRRLRARTL